MTVVISNEQKIKVTLAPKTASGNDAQVDGKPTWIVSNGDATLEVSEDGLSADIISGAPGTNQVEVSADADLGEGVRTISATIDVVVTTAEASDLGIVAGTPEPK